MLNKDINIKNLIETICKKKSIIEYLAKKDHKPVKEMSGGKFSFCCPMPDHKENKPSFVVYTQGEYENFYCYGCGAKWTIIDLVAGMEGISWKESLSRLSEGMKINVSQDLEFDIGEIYNQISKHKNINSNDFIEHMWNISACCRCHINSVNYDSKEIELIDKFYALLDEDLFNCRFDEIQCSYDCLEGMIDDRFNKYSEKQEEFYKKQYNISK